MSNINVPLITVPESQLRRAKSILGEQYSINKESITSFTSGPSIKMNHNRRATVAFVKKTEPSVELCRELRRKSTNVM